MRRFFIVLCGWLLPLLASADGVSGIELRLVAGESRPGDVIELQAEMRRAEYAEFVLHVPAHAQLHFVAHTREPVRYVEGEYVQRELFLLQPMRAGVFELDAITATIEQGGVATEVSLPPVQFEVLSYGAEDTSKVAAQLAETSLLSQPASVVGVTIGAVLFLSLLVWLFLRKAKEQPMDVAVADVSLNDLITVLEAGESGSTLMEQLLERTDLSLSAVLREALEAAAYANRIDDAQLLNLLRQEGAR